MSDGTTPTTPALNAEEQASLARVDAAHAALVAQQPLQNPTPAPASGEAQGTPEGTPPKTESDGTAPATPETPPADTKKVSAEDLAPLQAEFESSGTLSPESIEKAASLYGVEKEVVELYLQGVQAVAREMENAAFNLVGGQETYKAMTQWAAMNLSEAQRNAFDKAVTGTDPAQRELAIQGLHAQYVKANGSGGALLQGSAAATGAVQPFASLQELAKAQLDKRYGVDPAYTAELMERARVSNF